MVGGLPRADASSYTHSRASSLVLTGTLSHPCIPLARSALVLNNRRLHPPHCTAWALDLTISDTSSPPPTPCPHLCTPSTAYETACLPAVSSSTSPSPLPSLPDRSPSSNYSSNVSNLSHPGAVPSATLHKCCSHLCHTVPSGRYIRSGCILPLVTAANAPTPCFACILILHIILSWFTFLCSCHVIL